MTDATLVPTHQTLLACYHRLKGLDLSAEQLLNLLLLGICEGKMSSTVKKAWLKKVRASGSWSDATIAEMFNFLQQQVHLHRRLKGPPTQQPTRQTEEANSGSRRATRPGNFHLADSCILCGKGGHSLPLCYSLPRTPIQDLWDLIKTHRLCTLCLTTTHGTNAADCKKSPCSKCGKRHHAVLHRDKPGPKPPPQEPLPSTLNKSHE